jgi:YHS domain-containing protein
MKLLILLAVGYFCYRTMKNWMRTASSSRENVSSNVAGEIDDVMIQDPLCGVYFPKRTGIGLQFKGEELFFCSQECKTKYVLTHKET